MDNNRFKIGILTFQKTTNYGASLQAIALQEFTSRIGVKAEIIDYRSSFLERNYSLNVFKGTSLKDFLKKFLSYGYMKRKSDSFHMIMKDYISDKVYGANSVSEIGRDYNLIIFGSDQIWNYFLTNSDYTYYGLGIDAKKIAYAASLGIDRIDKSKWELIRECLEQFNAISVREEDSIKVLKDVGIRNAIQRVVDPVFLLDKREWMKLFKLKRRDNYKYLLVYAQGKPNRALDFARSIAFQHDWKVIVVHEYIRNFPHCINIRDASMQQFLELILNAECMVTTSFHGVVFSLVMNVPFYFEFKEKSNPLNSRILNILHIFEISNREITDKKGSVGGLNDIDFYKVNRKIEIEKENAKEFLRQSISECMQDMNYNVEFSH